MFTITKDVFLGKMTSFEMSKLGDALLKVETTFKDFNSRKKWGHEHGEISSHKWNNQLGKY